MAWNPALVLYYVFNYCLWTYLLWPQQRKLVMWELYYRTLTLYKK